MQVFASFTEVCSRKCQFLVGPKANLKTEQVNSLVSEKDEWFSFITDDYEKMIRDVAPVFPPIGCNGIIDY